MTCIALNVILITCRQTLFGKERLRVYKRITRRFDIFGNKFIRAWCIMMQAPGRVSDTLTDYI